MNVKLNPLSNTDAITVLVVDEHPAVARAIARVIGAEEIHVQVASSLEEARRAADIRPPDVAVMGLEGQDGLHLLVELVAMAHAPEVIVHTESATSPAAQWADTHDIHEVFEKPAEPQVLLDWTYRLLRRRRGEPESVTMQRSQIGLGQIIGQAPAISKIREQILRVSEFPLMSVLVCGETGTGKELVARAIHELTCPEGPFISLNCAAIPETLFESELFGHSAGAFTGAKGRRAGLLEEAAGGTFFLDEVGELPATIQPKLLRVLEMRAFRPVGANREIPLQARIISATNRTLTQARETFRPDLYYRLAGFALDTPSLRDRDEDILLLARSFLREFCRIHGRPLMRISIDAQEQLRRYSWPGNVRELRGVIENAAVTAQGAALEAGDVKIALGARGARISTYPHAPAHDEAPHTLGSTSASLPLSRVMSAPSDARPLEPARSEVEPPVSEAMPPSSGTALVGKRGMFTSLPHLEQYVISDVFRECDGNLSMAARTLGIPRSTLRDRLKKYGINLPQSAKK